MSVSIRISDDMYYEIMKLKADKVSINKTVDMLLGLALKGIEKCEMNIGSSDEAGNDNTDFPEKAMMFLLNQKMKIHRMKNPKMKIQKCTYRIWKNRFRIFKNQRSIF